MYCYGITLWHTTTTQITIPNTTHCKRIAIFRCFFIPMHCYGIILWYTTTTQITIPNTSHGKRIAIFRCFFIPMHCYGIILWYTITTPITIPNTSHRWNITIFCRSAIPTQSDRVITACHAYSIIITFSQMSLSNRVVLFCCFMIIS